MNLGIVQVVIDNWKELSAAVGAVGLFIAGRKSTKLLEKKQNVDAIAAMQNTYDVFLRHYTVQYEQVMKRLSDMELRNAVLLEASQTWERKFRELSSLYDRLKEAFDDYKKHH